MKELKVTGWIGCAVSILMIPTYAEAFKLTYVGETSIPGNAFFRRTETGGLSGMAFHEGTLWVVSDDKGKNGDPRFYSFDLKIEKSKVELKTKDVVLLRGFPEKKLYFDGEGMVRLANGDLILSSENNNDTKPRQMPKLFLVDGKGVFKKEIALPEKFLPESLGQQKKGLHNNFGFEGLSLSPDGKLVFALHEAPLMTDLPAGTNELIASRPQWLRLVVMKSDEDFKVQAEYAYLVDTLTKTEKGSEVFRGVSEILSVNEKSLLVLERGVRLTSKGLLKTAAIYVGDMSSAEDVSNVINLSIQTPKSIIKKKVIDLETDLLIERGIRATENFEALAWGPVLKNGKKSLLILSDNNFNKKVNTELLVFSVEE